jgi:hypothetical protein
MSTVGEVVLELLLLDGSNYESLSPCVLTIFRTMGPQIERIIDVSISPPNVDWSNLTKEEEKCLQLNAQATNVLIHTLSKDVLDSIMDDDYDDDDILEDAHLIWTTLKERYGNSKCDDVEELTLEKSFEEFSTSSIINEKPQVISSNGQDDVSTSTSSPRHESFQGNAMVSRINDHVCHTSTTSCVCRTKILKEEEVCDCYHPSEQSTSSPHATSIAEADVCLMSQEKKNPTRVNDFLLESHERQEELLIEKIKELKTLTKEHEKHKDSHASLVSRYEKNII